MNAFLTSIGTSSALRILVVDDDLMFREMYKVFLESKDVEVVCSSSIASATEILNQSDKTFDAVILDNQLEDGDGLSLVGPFQNVLSHSAIVMVSVTDEPEFFLQAFEAGIHDYMVKPVNLDLLWIKITKAIHQIKLKALSSKQNAKLQSSVDEKQKQQELAKYLFDSVLNELSQTHLAINSWLKPKDVFSGDVILHCQGKDGSWYFLLADAVGDGVTPAISLMPILQCFKTMSYKGLSVSSIVFELNDILNRMLPNDCFIAALVARISPWEKQLEVWSGGIPGGLILANEGGVLEYLNSERVALGIHSNQEINVNTETYDLSHAGFIFLHSDGVSKTTTSDGRNIELEDIAGRLKLESDSPFHEMEQFLSNAQFEDDFSVCLVDCNKLFEEQSQSTSSTDNPEKNGSFSAHYVTRGLTMVNADIPAKFIDLLKTQNLPQFFLQRAFTVLTELYMNALEHGVLKLESSIKEEEDGFIRFYEEKEQRILCLTEQEFIELTIQWSDAEKILIVDISDSGSGFMACDGSSKDQVISYGRGLSLIDKLSSKVDIIAPGNRIRVELALDDRA